MRLAAAAVAALVLAVPASARVSPHVPGPWSPDGRYLLVLSCYGGSCSEDGVVSRGGRFTKLAPNATFTWSPDGRRALLNTGRTISLTAADGTGARRIATGEYGRWAPDGKRIAYLRARAVVVLDVDSGAAKRYPYAPGCMTDRCALELFDPVWSPDGKRISVEVAGPVDNLVQPPKNVSSDLRLLDVEDGTWRDLRSNLTCYGGSAASWSPDGRYLAYYAVDCDELQPTTLEVLEVDAKPILSLPDAAYAWAPSGHTLAYATRRRVTVRDVEQPKASTVLTGTDFAWGPSASPLAVVRGGVIWIGQTRIARGADPQWSEDGRRLAYAVRTCGVGAGIHVRDLRTRRDTRLTRPC